MAVAGSRIPLLQALIAQQFHDIGETPLKGLRDLDTDLQLRRPCKRGSRS
jgi:hypothetical protein